MGILDNLINSFSKPVVDVDEIVDYINKETLIDKELIETILFIEEEYLRRKGII
jgi:hypothetical protein